ncbi:MAG: hypothetical protein K1X57_19850 [Gemmataceae bacterium]|nr:hypothetical protein [Gemmataceae bacterium]
MMHGRQVLLIALIGLCGCRDDRIESRRVPKPRPVARRTVAALVPKPDAVWFFKLSGPADFVTADEERFRTFLGSVQFADDPPVKTATPDGWRIDAGGGKSAGSMVARYLTLRTPQGNEVIVTKLGPESADVLPNVNRWRKEIGLAPIEAGDLAQCTRPITVGASPGVWVDLRSAGQLDATAAMPAMPPSHPPVAGHDPAAAPTFPGPPPASRGKVTFDTPEGWKSLPASGIRAATLRVGSGDESAEATIIPLEGDAGGNVANVNRWRTEIRLPELDEAALKPTMKELPVEGKPCVYVDLLAPEGPKRQQTLAVIVSRGATTWFIKFRGNAKTVTENTAKFEAFVRSLKLPAGDR